MSAVTFDFGQTLASLDTLLTAARLAERGLSFDHQRLEAALPAAWGAYNDAIKSGYGGHPWKIFMRALLDGAAPEGAADEALASAVEFLWTEQPRKNLWRRPIPGMIELVTELCDAGVPVGILSNSEGRLAELVEELGWSSLFAVIADSGKLGLEKPGREIFAWTAEKLGVPMESVVHVGDSYAADIEGALGAGESAVWFGGDSDKPLPPRVRVAKDAAEVRAALVALGVVWT